MTRRSAVDSFRESLFLDPPDLGCPVEWPSHGNTHPHIGTHHCIRPIGHRFNHKCSCGKLRHPTKQTGGNS